MHRGTNENPESASTYICHHLIDVTISTSARMKNLHGSEKWRKWDYHGVVEEHNDNVFNNLYKYLYLLLIAQGI